MSLRHGSSTSEHRSHSEIDKESGRSHSDCLRLLDLPPLLRVLPLRRFSLPVSSIHVGASLGKKPLGESTKNREEATLTVFASSISLLCRGFFLSVASLSLFLPLPKTAVAPLLPLHLALLHPFASASLPPSAVPRNSPPPTSSSLPPIPLSASNDAVAAVPRPDLLYFRPCHRPAMPLPHSSAAAVFIHQHRPPSPFSLVSSTGSCPPRLLLIASAAASPPSLQHPPLNLAGAAACLFFSVFRRRRAFPSSLPPASSPSSSSAATSSPSPPSSPPLLLHRCRHDLGMGIG